MAISPTTSASPTLFLLDDQKPETLEQFATSFFSLPYRERQACISTIEQTIRQMAVQLPDNGCLLLILGEIERIQGVYERMQEYFDAFAKQEITHFPSVLLSIASSRICFSYLIAGKFDQFQNVVQEQSLLHTNDPFQSVIQGRAFLLREPLRAFQLMRKAVQEEPHDPFISTSYFQMHIGINPVITVSQNSRSYLGLQLAKTCQYPQLYFHVAELNRFEKKKLAASRCYKKAIELLHGTGIAKPDIQARLHIFNERYQSLQNEAVQSAICLPQEFIADMHKLIKQYLHLPFADKTRQAFGMLNYINAIKDACRSDPHIPLVLGEIAFVLQDVASATHYFGQLEAYCSEKGIDPFVASRLGVYYVLTKRYRLARTVLQKVVNVLTTDAVTQCCWNEVQAPRVKAHDIHLRDLHTRFPTDPFVLFHLVRRNMNGEGHFFENSMLAEAYLASAAANYPNNIPILFLQAELVARRNKEEATAYYDKIINSTMVLKNPYGLLALLRKVTIGIEREEIAAARLDLDTVVAFSKTPEILFEALLIYRKYPLFFPPERKQLMDLCNKILTIAPAYTAVQFERAKIALEMELKQGKPDKPNRLFLRAITDLWDIMVKAPHIYLHKVATFVKPLAIGEPLIRRLELFLQGHEIPDAEACADILLLQDANLVIAHVVSGYLHIDDQDVREAEHDLQRAKSKDPLNPHVLELEKEIARTKALLDTKE